MTINLTKTMKDGFRRPMPSWHPEILMNKFTGWEAVTVWNNMGAETFMTNISLDPGRLYGWGYFEFWS